MKKIFIKKIILFVLILIFINQLNVYAGPISPYDDEVPDYAKDSINPKIQQNPLPPKKTNKYSKDEWIKSSDGRWWYRHKDGSYTKDDWESINNKWYLFDKSGWMLYGWQQRSGSYYYLGKSDDGSMKTGWEKVDDKWYFMDSDGKMRTDTLIQNNRTYDFFNSGELKLTLIKINEEKQEHPNWCWAASAKMIGTYKFFNDIDQFTIVNEITGFGYDGGGRDDDVAEGIKFVSKNTKNAYTTKTFDDFSFIINKIDDNKLLGLNIKYTNNDGHALVINGYDKEEKILYVVDPSPDSKSNKYKLKDLIRGVKVGKINGKIISMTAY